LIGLKLVSVGYRFSRYYTRTRAYQDAGAPPPVLRLIPPLLVLSVVVLFASGVEMWSFRNQFGIPWIAVHDLSAMAFVSLLTIHIIGRFRTARREALADLRRSGGTGTDAALDAGRLTRRTVIVGGTAAGLTLAVGAAQWPSVALALLPLQRAGRDPLDFPTMNYEGGAQQVDVAR